MLKYYILWLGDAMIFIIVLIIIIILFSVFVYKESTGYKVVEYNLSDKRINKDFTAVFLSDLHNNEYGEYNKDLIKSIEDINPDFVIFGGDMVTSYMERSYDFSRTLVFIENLSKKYPIYYGMGNHEAKIRDNREEFKNKFSELLAFLDKINVQFLSDSKIEMPEYGIDLYCLDIEKKYYRRFVTLDIPDDYLSDKLGTLDSSRYSVLMAHNPEHFKKYSDWGADLVLSGHVHGGVVNIPYLGGVISPSMKLFPKYDAGEFTINESTMILSRGIGTHTIPVRINNKAEIVKLNFKGE